MKRKTADRKRKIDQNCDISVPDNADVLETECAIPDEMVMVNCDEDKVVESCLLETYQHSSSAANNIPATGHHRKTQSNSKVKSEIESDDKCKSTSFNVSSDVSASSKPGDATQGSHDDTTSSLPKVIDAVIKTRSRKRTKLDQLKESGECIQRNDYQRSTRLQQIADEFDADNFSETILKVETPDYSDSVRKHNKRLYYSPRDSSLPSAEYVTQSSCEQTLAPDSDQESDLEPPRSPTPPPPPVMEKSVCLQPSTDLNPHAMAEAIPSTSKADSRLWLSKKLAIRRKYSVTGRNKGDVNNTVCKESRFVENSHSSEDEVPSNSVNETKCTKGGKKKASEQPRGRPKKLLKLSKDSNNATNLRCSDTTSTHGKSKNKTKQLPPGKGPISFKFKKSSAKDNRRTSLDMDTLMEKYKFWPDNQLTPVVKPRILKDTVDTDKGHSSKVLVDLDNYEDIFEGCFIKEELSKPFDVNIEPDLVQEIEVEIQQTT